MLIDAAIYGDRNVIYREAEKIIKYEDPTIETQCMWNLKVKPMPVIKGATGTTSESLKTVPEQHTGKARN